MQPSQKAGEPSMEEILASIRKIIADDPAVSAPAFQQAASQPQRQPQTPQAQAIQPHNGGTPASPAQGLPGLGSPVVASPAPGSTLSVARGSSTPQQTISPLPLAIPTQASPRRFDSALERDLADLLADPTPNVIPATASSRPAPQSAPHGQHAEPADKTGSPKVGWLRGKFGGAGALPEPAASPSHEQNAIGAPLTPASTEPLVQPISAPTLDALELRLPSGPAESPPAAVPSDVAPVASPLDLNAPGNGVESSAPLPPASPALDLPPVVSALAALPDPSPTVPGPLDAMQQLLGRLAAAAPLSATLPITAPLADDPPSLPMPAALAQPAETPAVIAAATAAAVEPELPPATAPAAVPPAPVAAAADVGHAPPVVEPPVPVAVAINPTPPTPAMTAPEPAPMAATSQMQVDSPSVAASVAPAMDVAQPTPQSVKTLDDTLAELLRPMVRSWLDQNMMRALEKAVRVEVADSVAQPPAKPGDTGSSGA